MPPTEILIIDDDPAIRDMLSLYLRSEGHAVRTAASGPEGIARCHEHPPSLVLCDLSMPGMSGLAVMSRLTGDFPDLPVLVVSGTGDLGDAIEALKLGAWDFVTKPIEDLAVLDHAIGRAFERARLLAENRAYRIHLENTNARLETTLRRLEEDEEGGRRIQFALLPDARVDFRDITCTHFLVTSAILGGDFVDYFRIDDARFGFYMADVSGHGVPSAVVTVLLKGFVSRFLENHRHYGDPTLLDPAALLAALNPLVLDGKHGKYLTMFYAVVDLDANTLSFANGGHFPLPLISDGDEVRELGGRSRPVGLFRDAQFNTETLTLPDRFALRLYSDGVLELLDGPGNDARRATLRSVSRPLDLDARNLAARLGMESNRPLPDDASILSIRRHAPMIDDTHGRVLYARDGDTWVLRFTGAIRYTMAHAVDSFLDELFSRQHPGRICVDLNDTESIDSTGIGLLAKLANGLARHGGERPVFFTSNPEILETLHNVCLDDLCTLVAGAPTAVAANEIPATTPDERQLAGTIVAVHRLLCDMNAENRAKFQSVVDAFERDLAPEAHK